MILNWAKQQTALLLGGSITDYPSYLMIGSGSGTVIASQTELIHAIDRQASTSTDMSNTYKVKWTGDWSSMEMSGLFLGSPLREFGICLSGTGLTGSIWSRSSFPGINFDGTNELRIEETWEVF